MFTEIQVYGPGTSADVGKKQTSGEVEMNQEKQPQTFGVEAFRAEAETFFKSNSNNDILGGDGFQSLFRIQTARRWLEDARQRPIPKMLFGEFWFEGEICILFADTNVGKSILAVQIADSISKGVKISSIPLETEAQKVIYFDFELSDKQFEARYAQKFGNEEYFSNHYQFNENFFRAEINPNANIEHGFDSFEDYLNFSLKYTIATTGAKVLVIDNLTYLKNETEKAKDALPLMKYLKELKSRFELSIMVLAHTPKRDMSKPITRNDLQGSKMLINFCDSSFAIGESVKDKGLRYLKQIKVRNAEIKFDTDNVYLCQIQKPSNFLHFEFLGFEKECEHLRDLSEKDKGELIDKVKKLSHQGFSQREIANQTGISLASVNRYLRK
jgi:hypothetical protein